MLSGYAVPWVEWKRSRDKGVDSGIGEWIGVEGGGGVTSEGVLEKKKKKTFRSARRAPKKSSDVFENDYIGASATRARANDFLSVHTM